MMLHEKAVRAEEGEEIAPFYQVGCRKQSKIEGLNIARCTCHQNFCEML